MPPKEVKNIKMGYHSILSIKVYLRWTLLEYQALLELLFLQNGGKTQAVPFSSYKLLKRSLESFALISLYYQLQIFVYADSERINRSNYNF